MSIADHAKPTGIQGESVKRLQRKIVFPFAFFRLVDSSSVIAAHSFWKYLLGKEARQFDNAGHFEGVPWTECKVEKCTIGDKRFYLMTHLSVFQVERADEGSGRVGNESSEVLRETSSGR